MLFDRVNETANITPRRLVNIAAELSDLKEIRFEILERLLKALSGGKGTDNINYTEAQEELAIVNGRIRELEYILRHAEWVLPGEGHADVSDTPVRRNF